MLMLSFNPAMLPLTGAIGEGHVCTVGVFAVAEVSMAMRRASAWGN